jgi:hypothetical protein
MAAEPIAPRWMAACVSGIERARDEYDRKYGRLDGFKITTEVGRSDDQHGECGHHVVDSVRFEVSRPRNKYDLPIYSGSVQSRTGIDPRPTTPWARQAWATGMYSHERHDAGRTAETAVLDDSAPHATEFTDVFRRALDQCLALAPASPLPPPDPTDDELRSLCSREAPSAAESLCRDAESAAAVLERTCTVEGEAVGDGGRPGVTRPALSRVLALGPAATPILTRLARSTNPAARAVAAMGFGKMKSDGARAELHRLESDNDHADTLNGCIGGRRLVSSFAKDALNRSPR